MHRGARCDIDVDKSFYFHCAARRGFGETIRFSSLIAVNANATGNIQNIKSVSFMCSER